MLTNECICPERRLVAQRALSMSGVCVGVCPGVCVGVCAMHATAMVNLNPQLLTSRGSQLSFKVLEEGAALLEGCV